MDCTAVNASFSHKDSSRLDFHQGGNLCSCTIILSVHRNSVLKFIFLKIPPFLYTILCLGNLFFIPFKLSNRQSCWFLVRTDYRSGPIRLSSAHATMPMGCALQPVGGGGCSCRGLPKVREHVFPYLGAALHLHQCWEVGQDRKLERRGAVTIGTFCASILILFWFFLPHSPWFCASKIAGTDPRRPNGVMEAYPKIKGKGSRQRKLPSSQTPGHKRGYTSLPPPLN